MIKSSTVEVDQRHKSQKIDKAQRDVLVMESANRKMLRHLEKQYGLRAKGSEREAKEIKTAHYQDHLRIVETELNTDNGEALMSIKSLVSDEEEKEYWFKKDEKTRPNKVMRTSIMEISTNDIQEIDPATFRGQELQFEKIDASSQHHVSLISSPSSANTAMKLCQSIS